jgi:uncharacterized membrane protein YbhN (UPF0104 family)
MLFNVARVVFLVAAVAFSAWSLRSQWPDIARDMERTSVPEFLLALAALYVGLLAFGLMWIRVLRGFGYAVPLVRGLGIFYVGQLGRYIPGSVWSFGAQATMARSVKVPPRTTVSAGLIGLGFSLATSGVVGMIAIAWGLLPIEVPLWLPILLGVLGLAVLAPPVINFLGTKVAGKRGTLRLTLTDVLIIVGLLLVTWVLDGLALMILSNGFALDPSRVLVRLGTMIGAYGLAYVVGVVIIFAPAGLGAREAALTFLLTPVLGLSGAAALAIVSRIPITITDFSLALAFWLLDRRRSYVG